MRLLEKRLDGFHELFSGVQTLSFFDEITIALAEKDSLTCDHPELQIQEENFAFRALRLFKQKSGCCHSFCIHIQKKIPLQAGLGGGSSNVATVLYGINVLAGHLLSGQELQDLAAKVSSDAPLFFVGGSLLMEGRGEIVRAYPLSFPQKEFLLVLPEEKLSTAQVYSKVKSCHAMSESEKMQFLEAFQKKPNFLNDLQEPAYQIAPTLKKLAEKLDTLQQNWWMSGSGSAHVVMVDAEFSQTHAQELAKSAQCIVTKPVSRSLYGWY